MTRDQWKKTWRQLRICRRESNKAAMDTLLFGSGFVKIGPNVPDLIQHIPLENIRFERSRPNA